MIDLKKARKNITDRFTARQARCLDLFYAMNLTRFKLDIVQIEKMEPEFADAVRESGKLVYERT
jgi:hypothetical protein